MKKKAAFYTLGCKVNQYETQAIMEQFEQEGYDIVDFSDAADIYVINTCTVTGLSDRKSRQIIRRARKMNQNAVIVAVGCYSQVAPDEVKNIADVDIVIGTQGKSRIVDIVKEYRHGQDSIVLVGDIMKERNFEDLNLSTYKERTRAYIKIQEGCTQFCSYCIIPYARGPVRSRSPESIVRQARLLTEKGFKEIVLTGIHIASYGRDLRNVTLTDIITMVSQVPGLERIRLGSLEPTFVDRKFIDIVSGLINFCPHFHLSLQSGCDETLRRMNRKYTTAQYEDVVDMIKGSLTDAAVTTDVMVGFPGETDEEFEKTYEFLKRVDINQMHVFKFSPRKGTPAAEFSGQVAPEVKEERSNRLIELSAKKVKDFYGRFIGRTMNVLYETSWSSDAQFMEGRTANYIKVVCKNEKIKDGDMLPTLITGVGDDEAYGELAQNIPNCIALGS